MVFLIKIKFTVKFNDESNINLFYFSFGPFRTIQVFELKGSTL